MMIDAAEIRGKIIRLLEEAMALADELNDGETGPSHRASIGLSKSTAV